MLQTRTPPAAPANLDGLWVLLVQNDGELTAQDAEGRVPVMARAGNDQNYLLVFKNVAKARQFVNQASLDGAEPRMVVRGNHGEIVRIAHSAGAKETLIDYDASTQKYTATGAVQ
ncbi:MAG TPA: hypothetical protein VGM88_21810 [Kofleriaceae bacterium]|jgi:hypothetical protein